MSLTVAELRARLTAETADFSRGISTAQSSVASLRSSVARGTSFVNSAFTAMGGIVGVAAMGMAVKVGRAGFAINAQLETTTIQFETLMGSAQKAEKHVAMLFEFAKKTPFETMPIIQASRMLQTFGGSVLNTEENIKMIGDASAAVTAPINELGFWVGRMYSAIDAGRPFGEAAMRLQELAVLSPKVRQMMEDMQEKGASASEVWAVFTKDMKRFDGAMIKQAGTWAGLSSTMSDVFQLTAGEVMTPLFDAIKKGVARLLTLTETKSFERFIDRAQGKVKQLADGMGALTDSAMRFMRSEFMQRTITAFKDFFSQGDRVRILLAGLAGGMLRFGASIPFVGGLFAPFAKFLGPIPAMLIAMVSGNEKLREAFKNLGKSAGPLVEQLLPQFGALIDGAANAMSVALDAVTPLIPYIAGLMKTVASGVLILADLVDVFNRLPKPIKTVTALVIAGALALRSYSRAAAAAAAATAAGGAGGAAGGITAMGSAVKFLKTPLGGLTGLLTVNVGLLTAFFDKIDSAAIEGAARNLALVNGEMARFNELLATGNDGKILSDLVDNLTVYADQNAGKKLMAAFKHFGSWKRVLKGMKDMGAGDVAMSRAREEINTLRKSVFRYNEEWRSGMKTVDGPVRKSLRSMSTIIQALGAKGKDASFEFAEKWRAALEKLPPDARKAAQMIADNLGVKMPKIDPKISQAMLNLSSMRIGAGVDLTPKIGKLFDGFYQNLTKIKPKTRDAMLGMINEMNTAKTRGETVSAAMVKRWNTHLAKMPAGMRTQANEIARILGLLPEKGTTAGKNTGQNYSTGLSSWTSNISSVAQKISRAATRQLNRSSEARSWGQAVGRNYASGIESWYSNVGRAAAKIAQAAANALEQHSPAKTGPLSKGGGTYGWGRKAAELFAKGMKDGTPKNIPTPKLDKEQIKKARKAYLAPLDHVKLGKKMNSVKSDAYKNSVKDLVKDLRALERWILETAKSLKRLDRGKKTPQQKLTMMRKAIEGGPQLLAELLDSVTKAAKNDALFRNIKNDKKRGAAIEKLRNRIEHLRRVGVELEDEMDQLQRRMTSLADAVTTGFSSLFDVSELNFLEVTKKDVKHFFKERLKQAKSFSTAARDLANEGLNRTALEQFMQLGPTAAPLLEEISGNKNLIRMINDTFSTISDLEEKTKNALQRHYFGDDLEALERRFEAFNLKLAEVVAQVDAAMLPDAFVRNAAITNMLSDAKEAATTATQRHANATNQAARVIVDAAADFAGRLSNLLSRIGASGGGGGGNGGRGNGGRGNGGRNPNRREEASTQAPMVVNITGHFNTPDELVRELEWAHRTRGF